ncbi:hypothetical protein LTR53_018865, partial [Teratosphaeriaceae sp. CCFEE 6253]
MHIPADDAPRQHAQPQRGEYYGAPDPDEEDIGDVRWNQTGSGQFRGNLQRTINIDPRMPLQPQLQGQLQGLNGPQGQGNSGFLNNLLGTIGGMLGNMQPDGQQPGQQP